MDWDFDFIFNVHDTTATTTPVVMALYPGLVDLLEHIGRPQWPDSLPGKPA